MASRRTKAVRYLPFLFDLSIQHERISWLGMWQLASFSTKYMWSTSSLIMVNSFNLITTVQSYGVLKSLPIPPIKNSQYHHNSGLAQINIHIYFPFIIYHSILKPLTCLWFIGTLQPINNSLLVSIFPPKASTRFNLTVIIDTDAFINRQINQLTRVVQTIIFNGICTLRAQK